MPKKEKQVRDILKTLKSTYGGPDQLDEPRPLEQLILLLLSQGVDVKKARTAMRRLRSEYVDWNEVRVTGVYELQGVLKPLGTRRALARAQQLQELLDTVYNRFNKLNLDFLYNPGSDPELTRKKERFHGYLADRSPALAAMMTIHGSQRSDLAVGAGIPKVVQRFGWIDGKSATVPKARKALQELVDEKERVGVQWRLYLLLEETCRPRDPLCPECNLRRVCPTGSSGSGAGASRSTGRRKSSKKGSTRRKKKTTAQRKRVASRRPAARSKTARRK